ncbi:hypothetical protein [uncultured Treponema sp.]|uniref:hypothetical protein n=1 Tax=uncultured Treponema sp. TaxID=162155 RepID=UPI0025F61444|nr:hypothetical protein [uncultured Treponema sp.]
MKKIDIEDLPEYVREHKLTKKEATKIIWEEIYMNPNRYGLMYFSEDQKSDLLIFMQKHFEKLFDKFIPGTITFRTFIIGCITNHKKQFLKNQMMNEVERRSLIAYFETKLEEDSQKYLIKIAEDDEIETCPKNKTFSDITNQELGKLDKRNKRIAELTALVLMMKACKDIDDDMLKSISDFTGIQKNVLFKTIEELKESMARKDERSQVLIQKRNNAFFFHRKYMQEMRAPNANEKRLVELRKKYANQTKKWENHNKNLSIRSNSPSNEEIARIIGIKPRTVSFYINHAKNESNRLRIQKFFNKERTDDVPENENTQDY